VFDEVDQGIGGEVGAQVGEALAEVAERRQVLVITHLPQIAARAGTQFQIEKSVRGSRTVTSVRRLDAAGREEELARMIGGASTSEAVRASARDLLAAAKRGSTRRAKRAGER
jgi:DNA repair protein RecN (Recombination protein N)